MFETSFSTSLFFNVLALRKSFNDGNEGKSVGAKFGEYGRYGKTTYSNKFIFSLISSTAVAEK